jgi:hypothetical protein
MGIADRFRSGSGGGGDRLPDEPGEVMAPYPALTEFLTQDTWADGSVRILPTLMLFVEDGRWKCCVNDRAEERSLWVSGPTVEACLGSIDSALQDGTAEWRRSWKTAKRKS